MCWFQMIQVIVSFCAGVYVGTEYEMMPYVNKMKQFAKSLEKHPVEPEESKPEPAPPSSWFSWGSSTDASTATTKKEE